MKIDECVSFRLLWFLSTMCQVHLLQQSRIGHMFVSVAKVVKKVSNRHRKKLSRSFALTRIPAVQNPLLQQHVLLAPCLLLCGQEFVVFRITVFPLYITVATIYISILLFKSLLFFKQIDLLKNFGQRFQCVVNKIALWFTENLGPALPVCSQHNCSSCYLFPFFHSLMSNKEEEISSRACSNTLACWSWPDQLFVGVWL